MGQNDQAKHEPEDDANDDDNKPRKRRETQATRTVNVSRYLQPKPQALTAPTYLNASCQVKPGAANSGSQF